VQKVFYDNAYQQYICYGQTDRRTDERQTTMVTINAYSIAVIKKVRKKMCTCSIGLIINVRKRKFHANFDVENESSRE